MTLSNDNDYDEQQVNSHIPEDELRTFRPLSSSTRKYNRFRPLYVSSFSRESDNKLQQDELMETIFNNGLHLSNLPELKQFVNASHVQIKLFQCECRNQSLH